MKHIVIAPYLANRDLFDEYRKVDPFCDVKFFTKESFLGNFYYTYGEDALLYVTNKFGKDYDISNQILKTISKLQIEDVSSDKNKELIQIKNELIKNGLIVKNEYFEHELENSVIDVYFYSEDDAELYKFLKSRNVNFVKQNGSTPNVVQQFHSNNDELAYLFNKIAELLDKGVKGNKIAVFGLSDTDELIFSRLLSNYKFHFNNAYPKTLLSKVYVNRFIANVLESDVEDAFEKEQKLSSTDETFATFESIVKKYKNDSLNKVYQAEIYQSIFKKTKLESLKYEDGIEIVNEPICPKDGYLFIINMVQGKFPTLSKDNEYFSDKEKQLLGVVTSEEENAANYGLFVNYLHQKGNIFLSYSSCSYASKYYPSPLIQSLNIKDNSEHSIDTFYSYDEAQFAYANEWDIETNYLASSELLKKFRNTKDIVIPYKTYTYQPEKINHFTFDKVVELSYTKTTTYYQCAYKYYLNNILRIDDLEDTFSLALGDMTHEIFQNISSGKSFDELYDLAYSRHKDRFSENDWVFLRRIKNDLKRVFDYVIEFEMQISNGSFKRELDLSTYLDEHVLLKGKLDKVIASNNNEEVAVVDYKTGKAKFEEPLTEYGLSLQLPTYSLLLKRSKDYSESQISGLFLQPLLLPSNETLYSRIADTDLNSYSKLDGLLSNRENTIPYFDSTAGTGKSKYLSGISFKKSGDLSADSARRLRDEDYFNGLAALAEMLILEAGHSILKNKFEINPKMVNGIDRSCSYCPFRDICYRDESSFIKINTKKNDEEEEKTSNELN